MAFVLGWGPVEDRKWPAKADSRETKGWRQSQEIKVFHECYTSTHDRCTENVRINTVTYSLTLKRSATQDCDWSIPRSSFVAPSFVLHHCEQPVINNYECRWCEHAKTKRERMM